MRIHYFHRQQPLDVSAEAAWDFFANPNNLLRLMPPWMAMRPAIANKPAAPNAVYPGWIEVYRVSPRWMPPSTWATEITHVDAPRRFVDEQKRGPFAFWHHTHTITPQGKGCIAEDSLYYAMPFGIFGEIAHTVFVRRMIHALFNYREATLPNLLKN